MYDKFAKLRAPCVSLRLSLLLPVISVLAHAGHTRARRALRTVAFWAFVCRSAATRHKLLVKQHRRILLRFARCADSPFITRRIRRLVVFPMSI
jgi:hypothetical protein